MVEFNKNPSDPSENDQISEHQRAVIGFFPAAAHELTYKSEYPEGVQIRYLMGKEAMKRVVEKQESRREKLIKLIPETYEKWVEDITRIRSDKMNGVVYDEENQKITAPSYLVKERFTSTHGGSLGNWGATPAVATVDMIAQIEKKQVGIDEAGMPENLYIFSLIRDNIDVKDDVFGRYTHQNGDTFFKIAVDPAYDSLYSEHFWGKPFEFGVAGPLYDRALEGLNRGFLNPEADIYGRGQ